MFGILKPLAGDVIDGPAFLYDNDFWILLLCALIAAAVTVIVLVCVRIARKKALRKIAEEEGKNPSGEE